MHNVKIDLVPGDYNTLKLCTLAAQCHCFSMAALACFCCPLLANFLPLHGRDGCWRSLLVSGTQFQRTMHVGAFFMVDFGTQNMWLASPIQFFKLTSDQKIDFDGVRFFKERIRLVNAGFDRADVRAIVGSLR